MLRRLPFSCGLKQQLDLCSFPTSSKSSLGCLSSCKLARPTLVPAQAPVTYPSQFLPSNSVVFPHPNTILIHEPTTR
ncbi:hypothetical protein V2G26_020863 [Clonostachys chloroleuca]